MVDSKVNIPVNIKGSQPQIQRIKKQEEEEHWISEEELYTEGSSDEEKPPNLSRKHLKGMTYEEILKKENDILEMRKSINELEESLANDKVVAEIYGAGELKDFDVAAEGEKIAAQMAEIKNLDKVLKLKFEEMKTAKLERIRDAEESTQLLMELSGSETSEAVRNNSEQFLKLLQNEVNDQAGENGAGRVVKVARRCKPDGTRKPGTFIERNIQLAKCGDGILSLTDEEKVRLKAVLKDIEKDDDRTEPDYVTTVNQYALDDETKTALELIDRKLEEHETDKFPLKSIGSSVLSRTTLADDGGKEKVKSKIPSTVDNELKRLTEVDKLLNSLNSATNEVINPLLDEELQYLIEESRQVLTMETTQTEKPEMPSKEKIVELVTAAKTGMPNFKFRYEH